ncbi:MAG: hypothetical protein OEL20_11295 [Sulfuritalea sp.]|nr:hypothetical protein [Sulfuritalea sp.]
MIDHGRLSVFLAGFVGAGAALAQVPDPMRPPDALLAPAAAGGVAAAAENRVHTVILRPDGRSGAVINGQHVLVGDRLGGKRVLKIGESEVVLQGESGREIIKVTPAIEKVPAKKTAAIQRRATGSAE